jgi:Uma2 family endonuclease
MAQSPRLHHYTYLEYRQLEEASSTKHEFLDGEIYAMAGGTPRHAALGAAVLASLANQIAGTPCRTYSADLRVRVAATGLATYPDATVIRGPVETAPDDRNAALNPKVIVEVLSEGTAEYDRGEKLAHYKKVPSLEAVVIVSQSERLLEIWQRPAQGEARDETRDEARDGARDGREWVRTTALAGQIADLGAIDRVRALRRRPLRGRRRALTTHANGDRARVRPARRRPRP